MKNLQEKKLLLQMMRAFGQEDKELAESIKREEELSKLFFKEETVEETISYEDRKPIIEEQTFLKEADPIPEPAETNLQPPEEYKVQQVANYLDTVSNTKKPPLVTALQDNEFQALRKTVQDLLQKVNTLSWGGGGTGVVRFDKLDDHGFPRDIDYLGFNTTQRDGGAAAIGAPAGTLWWNTEEDCLNIRQADDSTLQVGLEQYIRVKNTSGSTINNSTLVQFAGVDSNFDPTVTPLLANSTFDPIYTVGVLTQTIANGEHGRATTFGKVRNINTTGALENETWNLGDFLWASSSQPGLLTNVKPTAPNVAIYIAAVTRVDATEGEILVRPIITPRLFYGDFVRSNNQTALAADTAYVVGLNETQVASGFTLTSNSEIVATTSGLYKVAITLNFTSSAANLVRFYHWIRINGVNVPKSTVLGSIASNGGDAGAASTHIISLEAGDNMQVMWAVGSTQVSLLASNDTAFAPSAPAAIVNILEITL